MIQRFAEAGVDNAQTLMLLPFEIMRQHLESLMLRQFEIATRIYSKQAEELDNAFNEHVDRFELKVIASFKKISRTRQ